MSDRTSYVVEAAFTILDRDGARYNRRARILVGRYHAKSLAIEHAKRSKRALRKILWLEDIEVEVLTCWHLRSGHAAAQLVHDIYGIHGEPRRLAEEATA